MQNSANMKPLILELLKQLTFFIVVSWLEKCFQVTQNVQKLKCEGDWAKFQLKIFSQNSWTKYLAESKETVKLDKTVKM